MVAHYYGDAVRRFFMLGGALMIVTLPFFIDLLPVTVYVSLFAILFVGFFAGIANPRQLWVAILNVLISVAASAVFEYYAVATYLGPVTSQTRWFMWVNQALALNFFLAVYFSTKTLRGMYLQRPGKLMRGGGN